MAHRPPRRLSEPAAAASVATVTGEDCMQLYVIRRPSGWADAAALEAAAARSARIGNEEMPDRVRWIRSYVVQEPDGRLGTFCVYEAVDGEAIREHAARVG